MTHTPTPRREPRTESGRLLLSQEGVLPLFIGAAAEPGDHFLADFIAAIESEAVSLALSELEEAVGGLDFLVPRECSCHQGEMRRAFEPDEYRSAVIQLIRDKKEKR